jgi:hypothetical protein
LILPVPNEGSLCQWHGSRVVGAWPFVAPYLKVPGIGDTAPCTQQYAFRRAGSDRIFKTRAPKQPPTRRLHIQLREPLGLNIGA